MSGDYRFFQKTYTSKNANLSILAATETQADFITPKSANHRLYIQRIVTTITTYSAKTWTFTDSTAVTPVVVSHMSIPAAAVALASESDAYATVDFGPAGLPLTTGEGLTLTISAAGAAGRVTVEAYERLVGPVGNASTN